MEFKKGGAIPKKDSNFSYIHKQYKQTRDIENKYQQIYGQLTRNHKQKKCKHDKSIGTTKPSLHFQQIEDEKIHKKKNPKKTQKQHKKAEDHIEKKHGNISEKDNRAKYKDHFHHTSKSQKKNFYIDLKDSHKKNHKTMKSNEKKYMVNSYALPSYREYCIVKGKFIPIENSNDKRFMDDMLGETAATSPDIQKSPFFRKNKEQKLSEINQLKKRSGAPSQESIACTLEIRKKSIRDQSVLVKAAKEDIGIQYSERKSLISAQRIKQLSTLENMSGESQHQELQQSLQKAFTNLQMLFPSQQKTIESLNIEEKRRYREILENIFTKIQSPRVELTPRSENNINKQSLVISALKKHGSGEKAEKQKGLSTLMEEDYDEIIQQKIYMRQAKQLGEIASLVRQDQGEVNTSVISVIGVLENFFCFIEINHLEDFLEAINRMYGWSYMDKFRFISKKYRQNYKRPGISSLDINRQIINEIKVRQSSFSIIKNNIFEDFLQSVVGLCPNEQVYQYYHNLAIFDCINQLLKPYQPFYQTKGDAFPWSLNIFKCFTFYFIDEDSISVVISDIRNKIAKDIAKVLCGIIIDEAKSHHQVCEHREDHEQKMIIQQFQENNVKNSSSNNFFPDYQLFITGLFHELGIAIIEDILSEGVEEIKGVAKIR